MTHNKKYYTERVYTDLLQYHFSEQIKVLYCFVDISTRRFRYKAKVFQAEDNRSSVSGINKLPTRTYTST